MRIEELKERISPLPWTIDCHGKEYTLLCNTFEKSPMDAIANTAFCYADQHRENMTFAAHAANNFFPLLDALEAVVLMGNGIPPVIEKRALEAIKKAKDVG